MSIPDLLLGLALVAVWISGYTFGYGHAINEQLKWLADDESQENQEDE